MNTVFLLLGSNMGDRIQWLQKATDAIGKWATIDKISSVYETAAWGKQDQPDFLNMVIKLNTTLSAAQILQHIQQIEKDLGRQREIKWGQRTLDIDLLFFNNEIISSASLKVPHPFLQERRFALAPLQEIAGDLIHPALQKTITELLKECKDELEVRIIYPTIFTVSL